MKIYIGIYAYIEYTLYIYTYPMYYNVNYNVIVIFTNKPILNVFSIIL